MNAYDVNKIITQVGTVSDSAAVTLKGVTLNVNGTARLGTITLDEATINVTGTFTGTVAGLSGTEGATVDTTATFTAGKNAVIGNTVIPNNANVNVYTTSVALTNSATSDKLVGAVSVDTGVLTIDDTVVIDGDKNTLTVGANATAVIAGGNTLTAGEGDNHAASVTVNGTMTVNGDLKVTGVMTVNGTLDVVKTERGDNAKVTIDALVPSTSCGTLNIIGTLNVSAEENLEGSVVVNGILAVKGTVTGAVDTIGQYGYIKAYAGSDMTGAQVLMNENTGESDADTTVFHVNGDVYMTVYVIGTTTSVTYQNVLTGEEFSVPGYDTTNLGKLTYNDVNGKTVNVWYSDADLTDPVTSGNVGTDDNLYAKVNALNVDVVVSVGTGISLYIDDVRITENSVTLSVGTHTVSAVVDPGYKGDVTVSFNGSAVSGSFEVTADMASAAYEGTPAISATGNITADTPEIVIPGSSSGDDGMGLTDYLLIILVILIVIMAIMVAFRLMRS